MMYVLAGCELGLDTANLIVGGGRGGAEEEPERHGRRKCVPRKRGHDPRPEQGHRRDVVRVLPVDAVRAPVRAEVECCLSGGDARDGRLARGDDDLLASSSASYLYLYLHPNSRFPTTRERERARLIETYRQSQGIGQRQERHHDRRNLPRQLDGLALLPLGPEQIEEEAGREDGGDSDADEDVVGEDADDVVVVHQSAAAAATGDAVLLVDVIWGADGW